MRMSKTKTKIKFDKTVTSKDYLEKYSTAITNSTTNQEMEIVINRIYEDGFSDGSEGSDRDI